MSTSTSSVAERLKSLESRAVRVENSLEKMNVEFAKTEHVQSKNPLATVVKFVCTFGGIAGLYQQNHEMKATIKTQGEEINKLKSAK